MGFLVEYAKSGRSGCRSCRERIEQGSLRLGELVKSARHSGMEPHWFHPTCFVKKHPNVSGNDIYKFDELVAEAQELILKCLAGEIIFAPSLTTKPTTKGISNKPVEREVIKNSGIFYVQYAKSNQSRCISCEGRIIKGEVRISQKDFHSPAAKRVPGKCLDRWHHVDCFTENRLLLEFSNGAASIPGIEVLNRADQDMLLEKLPPLAPASNLENQMTWNNEAIIDGGESNKRRRIFSDSEEKENQHNNNHSTELESLDPALALKLQEQDALLDKVTKQLEGNFNLKEDKEKLAEILRQNHQDVPVSPEKMVERIADMMVFGVLERCSVCKGQFVLRPGIGYYCNGYISDFAKCTKQEMNPKRSFFTLPDELKSNLAFKDYEFIPRDRIILPRRISEPPRKLPKIDKLPLLNCKFMISDHLTPNLAAKVRAKLEGFGGKIVPRLGKQISAIISTVSEVEFMSNRMEFAQMNSIPVLKADFIHSITTTDFEIDVVMKKHLLSAWICNFPSSSSPTPTIATTTTTYSSYVPQTPAPSSAPLGCISSYFVN